MLRSKAFLSFSANTIYQLLSRVVTALAGLIIVRLIISGGGIDTYGAYQSIVVYSSLFWILTDFGLNTLFVRDIKANEEKLQEIFSVNLTIRLIMGITLSLICAFGVIFLSYPRDIDTAIIISATTIFFQSIFGACTVLFQTKLKYNFYFWAQIIGSAINVFFTIVFLFLTDSVILLMLGYILGNFFYMLIGLILVKKYVKLTLTNNFSEIRRYFRAAIPIGLSLFFSLGINRTDALIMSNVPLASISNTTAVGIYLLAYKVFELATIFGVVAMNTLYPILSEHFGKKEFAIVNSILKKAILGMLAMSFFVVGGTYIFMGIIFRVIAPDIDLITLTAVKTVLLILLLGIPFFYLTPIPMFGLIIIGKQKYLTIIYLIGFIVNFSLNFYFIPKYTYFAGAIITGITETLLFIILFAFSLNVWRKIVKDDRD